MRSRQKTIEAMLELFKSCCPYKKTAQNSHNEQNNLKRPKIMYKIDKQKLL